MTDNGFSFNWPWAFLALLVIPLILGISWWMRRRKKKSAIRVTSVALVRMALPGRTRWRRRIPAILLITGLLVLSVGAARPNASVPVPSNSTTIMLAMDTSGSMCSTDVTPNRITAAEDAAISFIKAQNGGVRIGLVTFAGTAGLLVPPTTDTDSLITAIQNLATARGTAIGAGILTAIDGISAIDPSVAGTAVDLGSAPAPAYAADVIVLLTDGSNTQGVDPQVAATSAAARGVRVYTIGFGTTTPTRMACTGAQVEGYYGGGGGGFRGGGGGRGGGNPLIIDEKALQDVAKTTGGEYYRAQNASQLQDALGDLPSHITVAHRNVDLAALFAGIGGLIIAIAVGLSLWWNRVRIPQQTTGPRT